MSSQKFYWQNAHLSQFGVSIEEFMSANFTPTVSHFDALESLFKEVSDSKIEETFQEIGFIYLEKLINHRNKIDTLSLIKVGKGHFKNNLKNINESIEDCSDNFVSYKDGDTLGKKLFEIAVSRGCCGSFDFKVYHNESEWNVHFNFGH